MCYQRIALSLLLLLSICASIDAKLLIITHSYNRPEFIDRQSDCFQRFLKEEYEFAVFNDASTPAMALEIEKRCQRLGISHYRVPQEIHGNQEASYRHGDCIQYSLHKRGFDHPGIVMMLDSDMFLIRSFNVEEYLQGYDIAAPAIWGAAYDRAAADIGFIRPQLVFMNMDTLPNKKTIDFQRKPVNNHEDLDTGASTYFYFIQNPDVKVRLMRNQFDVTPIGSHQPDYLADQGDVAPAPHHSLLYQSAFRDQQFHSWGCYEITSSNLSSIVEEGKWRNETFPRGEGDMALILHLIGLRLDELQFYLDFTFLHYSRGSVYHRRADDPALLYKAKNVDWFLREIVSPNPKGA